MFPNVSVVPNSAAASTSTKRTAESAWSRIRSGPSTKRLKPAPRSRPEARRASCGVFQSAPEQDERDDEHERAAPEEEPPRDGEVLDPPDPVGENVREERRDQGFTVICGERRVHRVQRQLEAARRLGDERDHGRNALLHLLLDVVAVQVDRLADVRLDDDPDRLALLDGDTLDAADRPCVDGGDRDDDGLGGRGPGHCGGGKRRSRRARSR